MGEAKEAIISSSRREERHAARRGAYNEGGQEDEGFGRAEGIAELDWLGLA